MSGIRVYLAGPEVFLPDCAQVQQAKRDMCAEYGLIAVVPGDADVADFPTPHEKGLAISARDETLMDGSDAVIANLTPFRGVGADPGTCYELGYMTAQGKPAFGYSNLGQDHRGRIADYYGGRVQADQMGQLRGEDGLAVEDFHMIDNLMLQGGIERRGGAVVSGDVPKRSRFTDLTVFAQILKIAAKKLL